VNRDRSADGLAAAEELPRKRLVDDDNRCRAGWYSGSRMPPPKLIASGGRPPGVTFTAQYLNSGTLPNGSSTGLVSMFAAAS
jgi:hypothetical protein